MKFGTFSLSQMPDQSHRVTAFDNDMAQFQRAEALGYDTVWLAEHLFSTYGIVTSTQVLAAAVARCTSRIAIGTAIVVLPFNHPLRTASDFALVDVLSHGRLKFGVGRAYQPHEFVGLGVPMEKSREMYTEALDIILKSWTNEKIKYEGEFWTIPEEVELLPKPVQRPTPPVYQATISPESFKTAARDGLHLQLASPFTYRTYREAWMDELESHLKGYEADCAARDRDPKGAERMILLPFFVHESTDKARELFGQYVEWFYNKVASNQLSTSGGNQIVKGYELTMTEGRKTRELGYLSFDNLIKYGAAIAGDPEECVDRLQEMKQRFGITEFVLWSNIGGIPAELAMESMELAAEKVIPRLQ
jgi:alkanesulfonate monooxygenase SsuD/methylene tetrahydromethanopterin reductase-like flavin-dependent oxidoreductase (luciferase family)